MIQRMNGEKIVKMEPKKISQRISRLAPPASDSPNTEDGTTSRQELMETVLNFGVMAEEINDLVQCFVKELMGILDPNDEFEYGADDDTDVLIDEDEEDNNDIDVEILDVLAFAIRPEHTALAIPLNCCFEAFSWFGDSEVCDPVPNCPGLYMTYDRNKIMKVDGCTCLPDSVVVFRIDEEDNFIGMSGDDMLNTCNAFEQMRGFVTDEKSGEKTDVFILE